QKWLEIAARRNEGNMGADEPDRQKTRVIRVPLNQLDPLRRGLAIRVNGVISIGLHDDERAPAHHRLLAIGVSLKRFTITGGFPFGSWAIESLGPRRRVIRAIAIIVIPAIASVF